MNIAGKRVLITGGSSGIGFALARAFLAKGAKIVVTGRRPDVLATALHELQRASSSAWSVTADVATPEGRATNLGELLLNGDKGKFVATTQMPKPWVPSATSRAASMSRPRRAAIAPSPTGTAFCIA